ncbi:MAG: hypothetical protein U5L76_03030 [Patescibacteria group bacterium]|nr:hypothetical protein [Patescibacteria group bacterium]
MKENNQKIQIKKRNWFSISGFIIIIFFIATVFLFVFQNSASPINMTILDIILWLEYISAFILLIIGLILGLKGKHKGLFLSIFGLIIFLICTVWLRI